MKVISGAHSNQVKGLFNKITWWLKAGLREPEELGANSDTTSYKLMTSGESLTSFYLNVTLHTE